MRFITTAALSLCALLAAPSEVRSNVPPKLPQIVVNGNFEVRMRLPAGGGAGPSVPSGQICQQITLEFGSYQQKTCSFGPTTRTANKFTPVLTVTPVSPYNPQTQTCRIGGTLRVGSYVVRARYAMTTAQGAAAWNPPATNVIDVITVEGNINIASRQTTGLDLSLTRKMTTEAPGIGGC